LTRMVRIQSPGWILDRMKVSPEVVQLEVWINVVQPCVVLISCCVQDASKLPSTMLDVVQT
jgi:hypothetical protein